MSPTMTPVGVVLDLVPGGLSGAVRCGGMEHHVEWTPSGLVASGHDPSEEDILRALGGERPPCVQLTTTWEQYKLEPLFIGALLTGRSGLLSRQTQATVGPRVTGPPGTFAVARLLEPFLALPTGLRRVLAADAAVTYSGTDLLHRGMPDDTSELRTALRRLLSEAAEAAFERPVEVRLLKVTNDGTPPAVFVRERGTPLVLAGQLPVSWAALAVLGLAGRPGLLVVDVTRVDGGSLGAAGYTFGWRDADLTPTTVAWAEADVRAQVRSTLDA